MKVFYQHQTFKNIKPDRGDKIAEINTMDAIDSFADVYYSGKLYNPKKEDFGLENYSESIETSANTHHYDIAYVRNNPSVFKQLKCPKIYFATPYDKESFETANYISTFTKSWTNRLRNGIAIKGFPKIKMDNVITIHQVVGKEFKPLQNSIKTQEIRSKLSGDFIIGCFGAIRESCFPQSFLHILPSILVDYPEVEVVFNDISGMKNSQIIQKEFSYDEMPYAISACDLLLYNVRVNDGNIARSLKVLESMACGVPILCPKFDARVEELGENYELFYPFEVNNGRFSEFIEKNMKEKIELIIDDLQFRKTISKKIIERSKFYSIDESAKRIKKNIRGNNMKVANIFGTRPQYIKVAMLQNQLEDFLNIDTGQHYNNNLSKQFIDDFGLRIDHKEFNPLEIKMRLMKYEPDYVLLYGDTYSSLVGLFASKNYVTCHVESGVRSYTRDVPEEIIRTTIDNFSNICFCPTQTAVSNLSIEGIPSVMVGDVMYDAFLQHGRNLEKLEDDYIYLTLHHQKNVDNPNRLKKIMGSLFNIGRKIVFPIHPRTSKRINEFQIVVPKNVVLIDPVSYRESLSYVAHANYVITDSGGVQRESYLSKTLCLILSDSTPWPEIVDSGWGNLVTSHELRFGLKNYTAPYKHPDIFGDGHAAQKIIKYLEDN